MNELMKVLGGGGGVNWAHVMNGPWHGVGVCVCEFGPCYLNFVDLWPLGW